MSFMDAMKKVEKTEVQSNVPKVNPLLAKLNAKQGDGVKKPNPLLKTVIKPVEKEAEVVEDDSKTIQQKAVEEAKELIKTEAPAEEVVAEEVEETVEEVIEEEEVKQEVAPKVSDAKAEETEEEIIVETPPVSEDTAVAEEVEEAPKKGKRSKRKTAKEPKVNTTPKEAKEDDETVEMFTTRISYQDAVAAISSPFANEDFEALKEEITLQLNDIVIVEDMNSLSAKTVNAKLSALYQRVWFEFQASKTLFDNLSQKDTGLIDVVKYTSIGDGTNDAQRKKAGIEACMRYVSAGSDEPVNLFELLSYAREQYYFFKGVMDHLSYKKDVMISMNAALKIEDKVLGSGNEM